VHLGVIHLSGREARGEQRSGRESQGQSHWEFLLQSVRAARCLSFR
jgi:hypothetical protein